MDYNQPTVSKMRFYSAGIVAENKALSSKEVEITPIEEIPFANGEITPNATESKAKAKDANGATYETTAKSTVTIKAVWMALSVSNRLTAPDVRRGEMVMIYQFGDSDKYYWTTLKEDIALRKLETVIYGFSGTTVEGAPVDSNNIYYLEISTHKKLVHFHTSKANGEPFSYDIQLNTKEGFLAIQDDVGNYIHFNSKSNQIEMKNLSGSKIDMNAANIEISAAGTLTLKDAAGLVIASGGGASMTSAGGMSISSPGSMTIESSNTTVN